jgi:hypothetical protein
VPESSRHQLTAALGLTFLGVACLISFRLISLPILVLALVAGFRGWRRLQCGFWVLFVAACLSPIDVAAPGYPGWPAGDARPGTYLVPVVPRMWAAPSPEVRRQRHMEYNFPSLFPPRWVIVWW